MAAGEATPVLNGPRHENPPVLSHVDPMVDHPLEAYGPQPDPVPARQGIGDGGVKLIISKDGVKREITTPFAMVIGTQDLDYLIRHLKALHAGCVDAGTTYGWVKVDPGHPDADGPSNSPPLPWTAV